VKQIKSEQDTTVTTRTRRDPPTSGSMFLWRAYARGFLRHHRVPGSCPFGSCSGSTVCRRAAGGSTRKDSASAPDNTSSSCSHWPDSGLWL